MRLEFTMPEALTRVEVPGLRPRQASCAAASSQDSAVTAKDLMVQPNPPRFLREGDMLEFTVKVSNQSRDAADRHGAADARRRRAPASRVDAALGNAERRRSRSTCRPAESRTLRLAAARCPTASAPLTYKAVGSHRQAVRRRGGLPAGAVARACSSPSRCRCRSAARRRRTFDFAQAARVRRVRHARAPVAHRADGLATRRGTR